MITKEQKIQILVDLAVKYIQDNDIEDPDWVSDDEKQGTETIYIEHDFSDGTTGYIQGRYTETFQDDSDYSYDGYGYCPTIVECLVEVDCVGLFDSEGSEVCVGVDPVFTENDACDAERMINERVKA